ncbi:MAG: molybdopterin-guanine dinucleotide biosynthesis protein B, partial [Muricoprocola sp.]
MVLAISGVKNSGKTTLITRILPELKKRGLQVAVIKHDGHDFEADVPGTDTWKIAQAGACGTLVFSDHKYMLVKYMPVL